MKTCSTCKHEKKYTLKELKEKLTEKERIFCHQYIIDWNGSRAAKEAGYSEKTRAEIAHQNLTKLHITQYIDFIKNDLEKEAGISKLKNLNELSKIAYSSISHLHDTWVDLKEWEEIKENNPSCMAAVESIDTKTETKVYNKSGDNETDVEINYVKIKLYSKLQALDQINKMMGYNAPDKLEHSGEIKTEPKTINISIDGKEMDLSV